MIIRLIKKLLSDDVVMLDLDTVASWVFGITLAIYPLPFLGLAYGTFKYWVLY